MLTLAAARPAPRAWPPWKENHRLALILALAAAFVASVLCAPRGRAAPAAAMVGAWLLGWLAALLFLARLPPRPDARREPGALLLGVSPVRRLALPLLLAPAAFAVGARAVTSRGSAGPLLLLAALVAGMGALALLALREDRRFRITSDGLELRLRGGGQARIPWEQVRSVRVQPGRSQARIVVFGGEGTPSARVSAWLDGSADLAAALLARAPAAALEAPGVREALEALARALPEWPRPSRSRR
jgi:hypothetical protein